MSVTTPEGLQALRDKAEGAEPTPVVVPTLADPVAEPGYVTVDPLTNPSEAQALANQAMGGGPEKPIIVDRPPRDVIELPAGYVDREGNLHTKVRIREMNGWDEEELARPSITTVMDFVDCIVRRCTVDMGGGKPDVQQLNDLLIGDRDAIVLGVRVATFGAEFSMPILCRNCDHEYSITADIETDIKQKVLPGDPKERTRTLEFPPGGKYKKARVNLMTGANQKAAYGNNKLNDSEQASLMISECLYSLDDVTVDNLDVVRGLDTLTRREVIRFLNENTCGPQWQAVMHACPNCHREEALPISMVALFQQ